MVSTVSTVTAAGKTAGGQGAWRREGEERTAYISCVMYSCIIFIVTKCTFKSITRTRPYCVKYFLFHFVRAFARVVHFSCLHCGRPSKSLSKEDCCRVYLRMYEDTLVLLRFLSFWAILAGKSRAGRAVCCRSCHACCCCCCYCSSRFATRAIGESSNCFTTVVVVPLIFPEMRVIQCGTAPASSFALWAG